MKRKIPFSTCLAALVVSLPASAEVIYSNYLGIEIPLDFTGVTVNIGNNGQLNPFFGGVGIANNAALQPLRSGTGGLDTILNLSLGSTIGADSLHLSSGLGGSQDHLGSSFTAGQEGYIGFKLNGTQYGWARVVLTNNTAGAKVLDWAYDNSGAPITAGGIRQVGQDIVVSSTTVASALVDQDGTTSLLKDSPGIARLTGTNTYTGSTIVSQGTLSIDGSGSINNSAVTVSGGSFRYNSTVAYSGEFTFTSGTIGGTNLTGSLGGLAIGTFQTISPGNSTGTATTTSETWAPGGTYQWEINDATGIAGDDTLNGPTGGWDLLLGSGSLDITATSETPFTIAITSLGLNQVEGNAVNFNDMTSYTWLIADFASEISTFSADKFAINSADFSNGFTGSFGIARGDTVQGGNNTQIYLTYTAVPEPRAALLGGLGLALLLLRRARRHAG